jgi:hypothetical protein
MSQKNVTFNSWDIKIYNLAFSKFFDLRLYNKPKTHNYKYVQSHTVILHQRVSMTPVTIIRETCNKSTIYTQLHKNIIL